ncbi:helix-turn-helix domain-containing protein [Glaciecola petra]|uniref:Helix-turn-helix domain-containing protein n=1 Tax=Glaciecola petra TaxID=3075602 RepID=A0ABU2ZSM0_9ALTE|nr:helix-turn-helix domain-containing protein [Aestuariibacter sp. P117]MDT0595633.1 helix-turn-helix domain-containing protein [Aestuariibacter sp. P117]
MDLANGIAWLSAWPEWLLVCMQFLLVFCLGGLFTGLILYKKFAGLSLRCQLQEQIKHHSCDANRQKEQLQAIAFDLKKSIKELINSQYVLCDKEKYHSIMQTPLRQNIHQLRIITERIMHQSQIGRQAQVSPVKNEKKSLQNKTVKQDKLNIATEKCCINSLAILLSQDLNNIAKLYPDNHFKIDISLPNEGELPMSLAWLIEASKEMLINAIKHNYSGVDIKIVVKVEANHFFFTVQDNGKGVSASVTDIFRGDEGTMRGMYKRASDYTDLINLYVIYTKSKMVGGLFYIRSAKRFGTTVTISLPVIITSKSSQSTSGLPKKYNSNKRVNENLSPNYRIPDSENKLAEPPNFSQQITLVTKNSLMRQSVTTNLNEAYNVACYTTLEAAISSPDNNKTKCLIIDTDLGERQAKHIGVLLQSRSDKIDIPILILGSASEHTAMLSSVVMAPLCLLEKPVVPELLRKSLASLIAQKERLDLYVEETLVNAIADNIEEGKFEPADQKLFLNRFLVVLEEHYADESFARPDASRLMSMSEKTLARKISKYTNMNFTEYLRKYRLNKAKQKILDGERVTFVAFDTGFSSPSYFTQCFRAEFGFAPSMLAKKVG